MRMGESGRISRSSALVTFLNDDKKLPSSAARDLATEFTNESSLLKPIR
jgi:hypothetical protein